MEYFDKKADEIWTNKIISKYKKIEVLPGKCRFNFRCHNNAVHEAIRNKDEKIAVVFYLDDGGPVLHFVNYRDGKFIDNTLGEWAAFNPYYFVRWIEAQQFNREALHVFDAIRIEWGNMIPWYWRWLVNTQV